MFSKKFIILFATAYTEVSFQLYSDLLRLIVEDLPFCGL